MTTGFEQPEEPPDAPDPGALRGAGSPPPQEDERPKDRGRTAWIVGLAVVTALAPVLAAPWRWMAGTAGARMGGCGVHFSYPSVAATRSAATSAHTWRVPPRSISMRNT